MTVALTVGLLTFGAFYLFSKRELLRVILGMVLLGHAANLAIIAAGGTDRRGLPFAGTSDVEVQADALPQAFVLTAIVIAFAITVLLLALAVTGRADDAVAAVDSWRRMRPTSDSPRLTSSAYAALAAATSSAVSPVQRPPPLSASTQAWSGWSLATTGSPSRSKIRT